MSKKILATVQLSHGALTRKIAAIKLVRQVFGVGLVEAKNFFENNLNRPVQVILNAEQFAAIHILGKCDETWPDVYLTCHGEKYIDSGLDFSADKPMI